MTAEFADDVALVTGASAGIGRATALAFAANGARVVVAARRPAECEETVSLIRAAGGEALAVPTDVTDAARVEALVARAIAQYGSLRYLCNSAGIEGPRPTTLVDHPVDAWDDIMRVNVRGYFLTMKYAIPRLLDRGGGAIVNITSVSGLYASTGNIAYTASKWATVGLTRAAAAQYAPQGLRINGVAPGFVETSMINRIADSSGDHDAAVEVLRKAQPLGERFATPQEIADAVVWLCSDHAAFITGQILGVDGGFLLAR